jgi:hypothetical protein
VDTIPIPDMLPTAVARPRRLVEAVASQSLREQGTDSRTARAWRWMLTGQGLSPISDVPGTGRPPDLDGIQAEAHHVTDPDECAWPPWRYNFDSDPDRQQARRVLRWLTGAADAIPLLDPGRGRYVGARFHFARSDEEIRTVRGWARHGLREHGDLPGDIPLWQAERPWQWPATWMNAAWLRGAIALSGTTSGTAGWLIGRGCEGRRACTDRPVPLPRLRNSDLLPCALRAVAECCQCGIGMSCGPSEEHVRLARGTTCGWRKHLSWLGSSRRARRRTGVSRRRAGRLVVE